MRAEPWCSPVPSPPLFPNPMAATRITYRPERFQPPGSVFAAMRGFARKDHVADLMVFRYRSQPPNFVRAIKVTHLNPFSVDSGPFQACSSGIRRTRLRRTRKPAET